MSLVLLLLALIVVTTAAGAILLWALYGASTAIGFLIGIAIGAPICVGLGILGELIKQRM